MPEGPLHHKRLAPSPLSGRRDGLLRVVIDVPIICRDAGGAAAAPPLLR